MSHATFIAAETDDATFARVTGLRLEYGFLEFEKGRVGGLYDHRTAREVISQLDVAGINAHVTQAETYAEGLRKTGTEMPK
jgi:hypothetical protein